MKVQNCPHCDHEISSKRTSFCPVCGLALVQKQSFTQNSIHDNKNYAALGARLLARMIDYVFLGVLALVIDLLTQGAFLDGLEWLSYGISGISQVTYALELGIILFLGYFVIYQTFSGQTLGKWFCQIRVLKENGQIPGLFSNSFREMGLIFTFMTGGWLFLIIIFSGKNKGFHDFLSGVAVYETKRL